MRYVHIIFEFGEGAFFIWLFGFIYCFLFCKVVMGDLAIV